MWTTSLQKYLFGCDSGTGGAAEGTRRGRLPEYVFLLGFDTECCLLSTAADLFEMGVRPLVLTEYSGSHDGPKYHDAGIVAMEHLIGPNFLIEKNDIKCKEDIRTIVLDVMSKSV